MTNNKQFQQLGSIIRERYTNIAGIAISKNDAILYEQYFNNYNREDQIYIASITKSVLSILLGIAIDKGYIANTQQRVLAFYPEYKIKRGEKTIQSIEIEHLLTMTAPYKYKHEPYSKICTSEDWTKATLDLLGGKGTVGDYNYSTVGTHILSGILTQATGMSALEFATEYLFKPLEIEAPNHALIENREAFMSFIKDKDVSGWIVDPKGVNTGGWGLALKTKDLLKLGQLYLNNGLWNNKRIVSANWIQKSTKKHSFYGERPYGFLWWIIEDDVHQGYAALGDGGNVIYVSPTKKLVVVIASSFNPSAKDRLDLIRKYVLPEV